MQEDPLGILKGSEDPLGILKKKDGGSVSQQPSQLQSSSKNILAQRPEELPLGVPKVGAAGIDRLFSAASEAKSKLDQTVSSRDDIYTDIIKENRLKQLDAESKAGLSDMVNPAMKSAKMGIITQIPVTPKEIQSQKDVATTNPNAYRDILKRAAKKDPEIAKNAYLVDAEQRAMEKPEAADKILQNADKIANGELNYSVSSGVLQKPEGAFMSLYRGLQERNRQVEDYDFLTKTLNDDAIISQLEDDRTRIDPDEPQPTPSGALAEFGMMAGMEGIAMTKSAAAGLATGLVPGAQAAAPYVAAFAASPEYYQRGYSTALRSAYNEFRQRGDSEYDALQKAREQAETEANLSAAEGFASGFIGAKIGAKPTGFTVGKGFNNAVKNTLVASKNFVTENLVEGGTDAAIAGGLQIAKNISAFDKGLDRGVFDGVQENVVGELAFSFGLGAITKAAKLAINPKDLNTLVTGVARQPKEVVDAKLGEMVVTGQADPEEVANAGKLIDEARKIDSQIPSTVQDEDTRVVIGEKIKEREALKAELATANEAFHKDIKDKIQNIDNEILNYATIEGAKQEGATESNIGELTGAVQGQREGGVGEGIQREAEVPKADVGDSNLGSKVAPGKKLFNEPVPEVAVVEAEFKKAKGIDTPEPAPITKLDEEKSKTIADAYEALVDSPNDPEVQSAYQAMADETMEQFGAIDKAGVKVEIWTGQGEPYKNSGEMIADVRDNKHMYIFSTEEGFGDTPITDEQRQQNALLRDSGIKDVNGKPLLINDIFRFVHDYFGHSRLGNSFGAIGEENAWNVHARMYSPLARRAMTTETRGQNSWVNFNKKFRNPDGTMKKKGDEGYVPPAQRPFADQKMALLPEEFSAIEDAYSVKPTAAEELTKELIKDPVAKVQESLKSAGITVDLIADPAEFDRQVQQLGGPAGMEGVFLADNGKVLLNEQKLKEGTNAGRIIFHEATHPIINIIRNTNPELYNRVVAGINAASDNPAIQQAKAWVESNKKVYDTQTKQEDETVVETIAMVGDGTLDLDTIETGFKQALIDMINTIARALGFKPVLKDTDVAAFKKLAAQIADVLTSGRDIAEVVGRENVREFQATGLQARAKDQLIEGAANLARETESKTVDGNMQPSMILTAMKGGKESTVYSGPASIEAMRELKPKMYISRAEELAQTHLLPGKKRMYSSAASQDQKLKWADDVYSKAKQTVVENLLYIYDSIPPYIRDISKLWYDGANIIAQEMASKYGVTLEQASAVIATQSPQKPWYDNVHLAHFIIDMYAKKQDIPFSQEMFDYYSSKAYPSVSNKAGYPKQIEYLPILRRSIGKPFGELSNYDKAAMVRADFDNNYERTAPLRIPTGIIVGRVDAPSSFSGYDTIAKGLSILEDGSAENISANLGNAYKVRNFNNNIATPRADDEVTIDTHAIAASYMLPLGSKSPEVKFDEATYAFFADAYREAAKQRGVLAREMQSITWEGARSLFPDTEKSANKKKAAQDLWNGYKAGTEEINIAQDKIKENGKDLSVTDWSKFTDQLFEENRSPNYIEELPLAGRGGATAGLRDGGRDSRRVSGMGEGGVQASAGGRLAPNGKPSNLTAKQYEQVRTPEFKNWFGDWENDPTNASKVVDENGEPLVVYHGSRSNVGFAFSEFNVPAEGVFFTSDYRTATWFSQGRRYNKLFFEEVKIPNNLNEVSSLEDLENYYKDNLDPTARIEEVIINDENRTLFYRFNKDYDNESSPLGSNIKDAQKKLYNILLRDIKDVNESTSYPFYEAFLNIKKPHRIDAKGKPFYKTPFEGKEYSAVSVSAEIKDRGKNDGLIIRNTIEGTDDNFQRKSDTYIAFNPNQIKSATENVGTFSTEDNRIQFSAGNREIINGFYSPIQKRVNEFKQPKASVQKWKEIVGTKTDEAVFSGLADWLGGMKPDMQLTKEDVNNFMSENRIEINEVELSKVDYRNLPEYKEADKKAVAAAEAIQEYQQKWWDSNKDEDYDALQSAKKDLNKWTGVKNAIENRKETNGVTKYESYQLPGGENYKEILITLPDRSLSKNIDINLNQEETDYQSDGNKYYDAELKLKGDKRTFFTGTAKEVEDWANGLKRDWMFKEDTFDSSHFDEPNIITHLRMNTRTDVDGKKVLFLEEVQSDWGQKGKREGFVKSRQEIEKEYNEADKKLDELNKIFDSKYGEDFSPDMLNPEEYSDYSSAATKRARLGSQLSSGRFEGVPSAPYVTNTNAWVKLGLKVALKEAVRQGADRIAWTTGQQQNDRYDLRKQVDEILWEKDADGTYAVTAEKNGSRVSQERGLTPNKLADAIGKDAADKIVNSSEDNGILEGEDLAVGGKGMKDFYGDANNLGIVGKVAKALVKELTGKEGEITVSGLSKEANQDVINRYNRARQYGNVPEALAKEYEQAGAVKSEQPAIDITPELVQSIEGGLPQFSAGNRPENNQNFKIAAFVMRKKAEGATEGEIAIGIASVTGMKPEDIKSIIDNPEQFIRDSFPSMSKLQQDNLIQKAKIQDIYRGRQFGKPIDKPFMGLELPQEMIDDYLDKTGRADRNVKDWAKDFKRKWLDPTKGLPDWTLAIKDFASGAKNIEVARAANTIQRLKDTAKRIGFNDWEAFSEALVMAKDVQRFIPNESGITPFDAYRAAANRTFTAQDDQLPALVPDAIKKLPDEIIPFVYAMRGQIDNLTRDLIGSGYVTPEQAVTLEKNLGAYTNRAYKIFSERGYVPEKKVYNAAVKFLAEQKMPAIASDNVGVLTDKQIVEKAMEEAKKDVEAILSKKKNPYFGSKSDRRDTGILQERQNIPEPIRDLMGQYTDPGTVFIMTVAKQAALKSASQYLNKLRTMGMGSLFFEREDPSRPLEYSVEIAAKGAESMNPLGGLYTTKEIAEAIDMVDPTYNDLTQTWMKLVGMVRWGKTVGSVATQFKNFESNGGFAVLNGYMLSGENTQAFKAAAKYVKGQYSKGEIDAITDKVIRLNLVGQSVGMRELREMLGSGDVHDIAVDIALNPEGKWGKRVAKRVDVLGAANKLYRLGDDFWKVYAYMVEREQISDARFNGAKYDSLTKQQQEQVDIESSERVKNTWPTYDRVVEGAKFVSKRAPIFGNFISFQAESLRVLANSIKLAKQDLSDPQMRHLGVRRMAGISAYMGLRSAITIGLAKMAGFAAAGVLGSMFGDDEEERNKRAIKEALPPFMRTGDLAVTQGDKPHQYTVVNLSSLDPYGVVPNSLNAFTEGREGIFSRTMEPGVLAAGAEFFSGFLEPEMTFESMWSAINDINPKTGERITMETDTDLQASAKVAAAIWDQLEPSSIAMIQRLFERENKSAELLALGGARPYDVDLHKSFGFVLSRFGKDIDAINREYNGIKYNKKMTAEEKEAAEKVAEDKKAFAISKVSQIYRDFINIGADPKVLNELINQKSAVKVTGYDKNTKNSIKTGKISKEKLFK